MPIFKLPPEWLLGQAPSVASTEVTDGPLGNLETVQLMRQVARDRSRHPIVRELALQILLNSHVKSNYYLEESRAIGQYVQSKVRYVRDPAGMEQLQDPTMMIERIQRGEAQGDCDDMALLIATLLLSIGHHPFFKIVRYKSNNGPYNHIYVVDYEKNGRGPRGRIVLDAIVKDRPIGFEVKSKNGEEIPA